MTKLFWLLLFVANTALAVPLELVWTASPDQSPTMLYYVYKKPNPGQWAKVSETKNLAYTWLVPSLGRYTFKVTAFDGGQESDPSNELKVIVERIGREDK